MFAVVRLTSLTKISLKSYNGLSNEQVQNIYSRKTTDDQYSINDISFTANEFGQSLKQKKVIRICSGSMCTHRSLNGRQRSLSMSKTFFFLTHTYLLFEKKKIYNSRHRLLYTEVRFFE